MTDPVAVLRDCIDVESLGASRDNVTAALAELDQRLAREARLEALVWRLLAYEPARGPASPYWGLVEAARKELSDGK